MKRTASIALVILLLLNVMGYYGLFLGLKYKNTIEITQRLDGEEYSLAETVTIKVPLVIPYYGDTDFERVNGEIEHDGQFYRLVKQKLQRDTLFIVCIRDMKTTVLQQALSDYVKTFTDHPGGASHTKTIPAFIKDYIFTKLKLDSYATGWSYTIGYNSAEKSILAPCLSIAGPPPKY